MFEWSIYLYLGSYSSYVQDAAMPLAFRRLFKYLYFATNIHCLERNALVNLCTFRLKIREQAF